VSAEDFGRAAHVIEIVEEALVGFNRAERSWVALSVGIMGE